METRFKKLLHYLYALQGDEGDLEAWIRFGKEIHYTEFHQYSDRIAEMLLKGLALQGVDHQHFALPGISLLKLSPLDLDNPLLLALLRETLLPDAELEIYLTEQRRSLLENPTLAKQHPAFVEALDAQCALNEYVYYESPEETALLEKDPTLLSLYRPIKSTEPLEQVPSLKPITDPVSKKVEQQYDENPYPRYQTIDLLSLQPIKADNILVAGCGTGQHAINCALSAKQGQVLAVDLSRSCLSYAIKKAREWHIPNITFLQADILDLGDLDQTFDLIECSGVLHHMENPVQGWRILTKLLKPGGKMIVSLYSELARKHVVAARAFIAKHHYQPTPEGIRACRHHILSLPDTDLVKQVSQGIDFYSASSCRDLLFHVQESRFTLPQLERILQDLGLKFLGFELKDPAVLEKYLARFPDDPQALSLKNWDTFEQENPLTFLGMYHLWLKK